MIHNEHKYNQKEGNRMFDTMQMIRNLSGPCACGVTHEAAIRDIRVGSGLVHRVGEIL